MKMKSNKPKLEMVWKINTNQFLKEIIESNDNMRIMTSPANILKQILKELGERASELNDDKLNAIMCRLSIYGIADQYDRENRDDKKTKEVLAKVGWC